MYLIRRAKPDDADTLLKLAKTVHFINLPADKDLISEKIRRSRVSFHAAATGEELHLKSMDGSASSRSPMFMFVMEDTETGNCLGASMCVSKMGGPGYPNLSFQLERREMFSRDLQAGTTHVVARLFLDESEPSEIGGLILGPSFRRHPLKLGKQLSMIRFHFMGLHRELFGDKILAEMMAPISADGHNTFWDALGRRFINLSYEEADKFCQKSREFMTSLLPKEDLYLSMLHPNARAVVGEVGKDTVPAKRMLEKLGFKYTGRIDPFDGGPHMEAVTDDIPVINDTHRVKYAGICKPTEANRHGLISNEDENGRFLACYAPMVVEGDSIRLIEADAHLLEVEMGASLGLTPLEMDARPRKQRAWSGQGES